jgi:nitroimidazol reductase NimA-like FMN-containing flavoprotein (pyridoxamine 5'-phosphate oxidase superfamily)
VPSKRDQIKMTDAEIAEFLGHERVATVSSNGPDGWPHVTALWYVMRDSEQHRPRLRVAHAGSHRSRWEFFRR